MKKTELEEAKQYLATYLAQQEMRPTITRIRILEYIFTRKRPFSADTLYENMKGIFRVSRATVYNTLQLFLDCNLIVKYHMSCNSSLCFELSKNIQTSTHHVILCTNCGKSHNLVDRDLSNLIQTRTYRGFNPTYHLLTIYGVCAECSRKLKLRNKKNLNKTV